MLKGCELPGAPACSQPVDEQMPVQDTYPRQPGWATGCVVAGGYQGPTVCITCDCISFRGGSAQ